MPRSFILKVFLFLLLFKALDLALFQALSWVDRSGPPEDPALQALYDGQLDAEIVIFGSSRANMLVNPLTLERVTGLRAYNLAMLGADFNQHVFTMKEYLERYGSPRIALFEADIESLDKDWGVGFQTEAFRPYIRRSDRVFRLFGNTPARKIAYKTIASLVFRNRLLHVIGKRWILPDWQKKEIFVQGSRLREGRDPKWEDGVTWRWNVKDTPERRAKFEEFAAWVGQQNFPVVLLTMPRYRQERQIEPNLREGALAFYRSLADRHPNLYFADFSDDKRMNDHQEYYWDLIHMNAKGADYFAEILGGELLRLIQPQTESARENTPAARNPSSSGV